MGNSNIVVAYPDLDRVHLDTMVHITCRLTGYQIDASLYLLYIILQGEQCCCQLSLGLFCS